MMERKPQIKVYLRPLQQKTSKMLVREVLVASVFNWYVETWLKCNINTNSLKGWWWPDGQTQHYSSNLAKVPVLFNLLVPTQNALLRAGPLVASTFCVYHVAKTQAKLLQFKHGFNVSVTKETAHALTPFPVSDPIIDHWWMNNRISLHNHFRTPATVFTCPLKYNIQVITEEVWDQMHVLDQTSSRFYLHVAKTQTHPPLSHHVQLWLTLTNRP